jgi:hypothetical protein
MWETICEDKYARIKAQGRACIGTHGLHGKIEPAAAPVSVATAGAGK